MKAKRKRSGLSRDGHRRCSRIGTRTLRVLARTNRLFSGGGIFLSPRLEHERPISKRKKPSERREREREKRERETQSTTDPRKKTRVGCDVCSPSPLLSRSFPTIINPAHRKTRHGKSFFPSLFFSRRNNTLSRYRFVQRRGTNGEF